MQQLSEHDIIHIITYNTDSSLIYSGNVIDKTEIVKKIKSIKANGKTNLESGLKKALENIICEQTNDNSICKTDDEKQKVSGQCPPTKPTNVTYKKAMFVFSDGIINAGTLIEKKLIARYISNLYELHDIEFSSFGIGLEYDEEVMNCISSEGNGYLYHIKDSRDISSVTCGAFSYLKKSIATEVSLTCYGASKITYGQKVVGGDHEKTINTEKIIIGSLCKDNEYIILCEYMVHGKEDEQIQLKCLLEFKSLANNEKIRAEFGNHVTIKKGSILKVVNPETIEIEMQKNLGIISTLNSTAITFVKTKSYKDAKSIIESIITILKNGTFDDAKYFDQKFKFNLQLTKYNVLLMDLEKCVNNPTLSISDEELLKKLLSTKSETNNGSTNGGGYMSVKNWSFTTALDPDF